MNMLISLIVVIISQCVCQNITLYTLNIHNFNLSIILQESLEKNLWNESRKDYMQNLRSLLNEKEEILEIKNLMGKKNNSIKGITV